MVYTDQTRSADLQPSSFQTLVLVKGSSARSFSAQSASFAFCLRPRGFLRFLFTFFTFFVTVKHTDGSWSFSKSKFVWFDFFFVLLFREGGFPKSRGITVGQNISVQVSMVICKTFACDFMVLFQDTLSAVQHHHHH